MPQVSTMSLPDVGPVSVPIGEPVAHLKCFEAVALKEKQVEAGVWECSPGVWRRQVLLAELCHFVSGPSSRQKAAKNSKSKPATQSSFRPTRAASGTSEKPSANPTSPLITDFQLIRCFQCLSVSFGFVSHPGKQTCHSESAEGGRRISASDQPTFHPTNSRAASAKIRVCRSTSAAVVAGHISAIL